MAKTSDLGRTALISLGSNADSRWGDPTGTVQKAMLAVAQLSDRAAQFSQFYATSAFPAGSGPDFVNAAMAMITTLSPHDLLSHLHQIEAEAGRERHARWAQRTLDLDLIGLGNEVYPDEQTHAHWRNLSIQDQMRRTPDTLILPHPRMQDRAFVLVPLAEIAPNWVHPLLGQSIAALCAQLPQADRADVVPLTPRPTA